MGNTLEFDLPALRAGKVDLDENETQYALAAIDYAFENRDGTRRKIVAFEAKQLHLGPDGMWNPSDDDELEVVMALEYPDNMPEGEFEADIRLSKTDAAVFAFAILEAVGVDVERSSEPTGEQYITTETYAAKVSVYLAAVSSRMTFARERAATNLRAAGRALVGDPAALVIVVGAKNEDREGGRWSAS